MKSGAAGGFNLFDPQFLVQLGVILAALAKCGELQ
jgi:hypothetical protein